MFQNVPPDMSICMFFINQALSVRALSEMLKKESDSDKKESKGKGASSNKTLLYGHAIQLLHAQSQMVGQTSARLNWQKLLSLAKNDKFIKSYCKRCFYKFVNGSFLL